MHFPSSLGSQKCGQQLLQLLPYCKAPMIWSMDANQLVGKLSGDFTTLAAKIDTWPWVWSPQDCPTAPELASQPDPFEYQTGGFVHINGPQFRMV
jgi:hypothetical protein